MARQTCQLAEPLRGLLKQQALGIERQLASEQRRSGSITCPRCYRLARWKKQDDGEVKVSCEDCGFGATAAIITLE